jgi:membrane protease subunit (stomatin/prohibitin family)
LIHVKLILQIALGVFIGMSASQLLIDAWRTHRQEQVAQAENARQEQVARERQQQAEKIRKLVSEKLQQQGAEQSAEAASDVMPLEPDVEDAERSAAGDAQP